MTVTSAALKVLEAMTSGVLENADGPLLDLKTVLKSEVPLSDISSAQTVLDDARRAVNLHRSRIVLAIHQLEQSVSYDGVSSEGCASWEMKG